MKYQKCYSMVKLLNQHYELNQTSHQYTRLCVIVCVAKRWNFTSDPYVSLCAENINLRIRLHFKCFFFVFQKTQNKKSTSKDETGHKQKNKSKRKGETNSAWLCFILLRCNGGENYPCPDSVICSMYRAHFRSTFFKC